MQPPWRLLYPSSGKTRGWGGGGGTTFIPKPGKKKKIPPPPQKKKKKKQQKNKEQPLIFQEMEFSCPKKKPFQTF